LFGQKKICLGIDLDTGHHFLRHHHHYSRSAILGAFLSCAFIFFNHTSQKEDGSIQIFHENRFPGNFGFDFIRLLSVGPKIRGFFGNI